MAAYSSTKSAVAAQFCTDNDNDFEEIADLALELHNDCREDHNSPPLELDWKLCEEAQAQAVCVGSGTKPAAIVEGVDMGRNIFKVIHPPLGTSSEQVTTAGEAVREAVSAWYGHSRDYKWNDPMSSPATAKQFSQLLWKSSKRLGVGVVVCGKKGVDFQIVVLTLYSPAGNCVSNKKYEENVEPSTTKRTRI